MEIYILNKYLHKLFVLADYSYAQYIDSYNGLGTFQVKATINEDTPTILSDGYYILMDEDVCGVIQSKNPVIDEQTKAGTLTLEGYLVTELLTRRCIPKSTSMTGTAPAFANKIVNENCVNPEDPNRALPIVLSDSIPQGISSKRQVTGGEVEAALQEMLEPEEMGHALRPILTSTGIANFLFSVYKGADRTIGTEESYAPVVWSADLKNVLSGSYRYNSRDYKNTAYVAGEGEGTEREVKVLNDSNSGVNRYELYVDARDLQSTDEEGNQLTPQEYDTVLENRGLEKLKECEISETYEATVSMTDDKYIYKRDFFLGDKVTLEDRTLGIRLDTRIVSVQVSDTRQEIKYDLTFGNTKPRIAEKLRRKGVI